MYAGISQRSPRRSRRSAGHFVNPRSSCWRCEVARLSRSVAIPIYLGPFTRVTEDSEFTATNVLRVDGMDVALDLRSRADRVDGALPSSQR